MGLRNRYREVMENRHPWWKTSQGKRAWFRIKYLLVILGLAGVVFLIGLFDLVTLGLAPMVVGFMALLMLIMLITESLSIRMDILTWDLERLLEVPLGVPRGSQSD